MSKPIVEVIRKGGKREPYVGQQLGGRFAKHSQQDSADIIDIEHVFGKKTPEAVRTTVSTADFAPMFAKIDSSSI